MQPSLCLYLHGSAALQVCSHSLVPCNGAASGLQAGPVLGEHITHLSSGNGAAPALLLSLHSFSHILRKWAPEPEDKNNFAYIALQYVN